MRELESKQALRKRVAAQRAAIAPPRRRDWDARIQEALLAHERWRRASAVMAYCSMPEEVGTRAILEDALARNKRLLLPRCVPGEKRFEAVEVRDLERDLTPGRFRGLLEPLRELPAWSGDDELDLIVVPGVAFDRAGRRLGFGAGMYDRFLAQHPKPWRVGLAYELQVLDAVPSDDYDVAVHAVLTEKGFLPIGESGA